VYTRRHYDAQVSIESKRRVKMKKHCTFENCHESPPIYSVEVQVMLLGNTWGSMVMGSWES